MKTKDRILAAGLRLFNERGERNVSTNHIATDLGISPGNLYYHFRNKNEIVRQLFEQYQSEVQGFLVIPQGRPISFQDKVQYLESILNSMWAFRFLHRDLPHLLAENAPLRDAYQKFASDTLRSGREVLQSLVDVGVMVASGEQLDALVVNIWVVVTAWGSLLQAVAHPQQSDPDIGRALLQRAIYQVIALEEPYLCEALRPMVPELKQRYLGANSSDPLLLFSFPALRQDTGSECSD
ncbi:MAG: TetR/AcrR family transcriptional regulator [Pseudomonadota bacterium]|nr:TetR/AcrR family transcriptional regulator [Pseudomonadota bacterium]